MGHTPGPWVVRHPMDDEHAEIYAEAGGALVAWPTDNNGNLIAAAPELLAALKQLVQEASDIGWDCSHVTPVIAKAEGGASDAPTE